LLRQNVLTLFQITSQLSTHAWQADFQSACARDKEEIVQYLGDIKNKQDLIAFSQAQQAADLHQIMELMQKVFLAPVILASVNSLLLRIFRATMFQPQIVVWKAIFITYNIRHTRFYPICTSNVVK
jgi:hypothetical protein